MMVVWFDGGCTVPIKWTHIMSPSKPTPSPQNICPPLGAPVWHTTLSEQAGRHAAFHTAVQTSTAALSHAFWYWRTWNIISWHNCNCWPSNKQCTTLTCGKRTESCVCLHLQPHKYLKTGDEFIFSNDWALLLQSLPNPPSCKKRSQIARFKKDWKSSQSKTEVALAQLTQHQADNSGQQPKAAVLYLTPEEWLGSWPTILVVD